MTCSLSIWKVSKFPLASMGYSRCFIAPKTRKYVSSSKQRQRTKMGKHLNCLTCFSCYCTCVPHLTELHPHKSFSLFFFFLFQISFAMISLLESETITVDLLEQLFTESWLKKQAESVLGRKLSGRSALEYNWSACHILGCFCQVCFGFLVRDLLTTAASSYTNCMHATAPLE